MTFIFPSLNLVITFSHPNNLNKSLLASGKSNRLLFFESKWLVSRIKCERCVNFNESIRTSLSEWRAGGGERDRERTGLVQKLFNSIWSSYCDSNESLVQVFSMFIQFEVLLRSKEVRYISWQRRWYKVREFESTLANNFPTSIIVPSFSFFLNVLTSLHRSATLKAAPDSTMTRGDPGALGILPKVVHAVGIAATE